jgi:hypothetical protein
VEAGKKYLITIKKSRNAGTGGNKK